MKVLYLGYAINVKDCNKFKGPSIAGAKMENGLIGGLNKFFKNDLDIITVLPIAKYPLEKKVIVKKKIRLINNNIKALQIGFINIFIIKQFTQMMSVLFNCLRWILKNKRDNKTIFVYNSYIITSIPILLISKFSSIKCICILADPPIAVELKGMKKWFGNMQNKFIKYIINLFDSMVVLNKYVIKEYNYKKRFMIMEGAIDKEEIEKTNESKIELNEKKIIFSGALTEYNGIEILIQAFKKLKDKNYKLFIYGSGSLEKYVRNEAELNKGIIFCGLKDNDEVRKAQRGADLLINPRPSNTKISKMTFPSKLIEYMCSGTPVLTTKLNGIEEEYFKYLMFIEEETPDFIAKSIIDFFELPQSTRKKIASDAKRFIVQNKTWEIQTKKIIDFINN
ncbi:glycosyltransferase [Clostridium sp.]|uniref:glycosyltransferase n=1 Tax=Clostridium sp. TaxID=1506 RepID=UPI003217E2CE